ncbi:hypothetical protein RI129_003542 [Pyrocoelia pectoralis]|uniref:Peroxisomal membrane protein PEX13 n=1 Tax=Pyrocoelia pectoralis TaxID=417401 RepID=A0AAN7ZIQ7_9COLE
MTSPNSNINDAPILRSSNPNPAIPQIGPSRNVPVLPPKPTTGNYSLPLNNSYGHMPYSGYGYGSGYSSMGYQSPMYNSYGYGNSSYGYGNHGMYGVDSYSNYGPRDDAERRFIQFAEDSSRHTFASVESVVRAVSSISMMLDNTLFAMTSSFRAILSVAENFGRLRTLFGHIWYSLNIFRLFRWLYKKLMVLMGYKVMDNAANKAWREAYVKDSSANPAGGGYNWPIVAFFGVIISAPYLISKFLLPKCEDRYNPEKWKTPGVKVKAAFDFRATSQNELSLRVNDELLLAPTYIQEEMKLTNTGWAFAVGNGKSGLIPLNYIVLSKRINNGGVLKNSYNYNNNNKLSNYNEELPTLESKALPKNNVKRVSFGENQIIESNGTERIVKIPDTDSTTSTSNDNNTNLNDVEVLNDKEGLNDGDGEFDKVYTNSN